MNLNNTSPNTAQNMNRKTGDFTAKVKNLVSDEKESLTHFGTKAYDEVENMAADVLKQVGAQLSEFTSRSISLIRKNPVIAVAAAVTIGLVIAKVMRKTHATAPRSEEKTMSH